MSKKLTSALSALLALLMLVSVFSFTASAKMDEISQLEATMKALTAAEKTASVHNDMTADQFIAEMTKFIPEGCDVKLSFTTEANYRCYNASSKKDGQIHANFQLNCGPYQRHHIVTVIMPKLTGEAALLNADNEKLDEDASLVNTSMKQAPVTNLTTKEELLEVAKKATIHGSTLEWLDYKVVESTRTARGSIKGTIKVSYAAVSKNVTVSKLINVLTAEQEAKEAEAKANAPQKSKSGFDDVAVGAYYEEPVIWAVDRKVTSGTSAFTFSPDDVCTRAQIITFLWRAVGSPNPTEENPFTDIKESNYFYKAALWANENGLVTSEGFAGTTPCTRAATVTYIWTIAGKPEAANASSFADVAADAEYAAAVAWAVEKGITSGTSATEFSPDMICSRGQIVTFLYRAFR